MRPFVSAMDAISAKLRDKRNRVLERETNELKDELCAMRHIVHLLDNIKRVSNDCIQYLHLMVDAAIRTDNNQLDQLRDDVQELEEELKAWERKYQLMSQMQTSPPKTSPKSIVNNVHNIASDHTEHSTDHLDHSANGSFYDSDRNEDCAQSSSHNSLVLMPQELCEMSMETNDNEPVVITSNNASPQPQHQPQTHMSVPQPILPAGTLVPTGVQDLCSGKSLFECDWVGCDYRTNMRQRLVMHKRLHAGEMLFSCDVPGCGYQSNYKGNIKIHKKHRHRLEVDENKQYSPLPINAVTTNPIANTISSHSPNLSHHLTKNNNISSNMIRKRKRKKKFRLTVSRTNSANKPTACAVGGQPVTEEDDTNAQSAKAERISTLFTCTVKGCNYRSKWKQCLTAHQLLHAGVKPFKCDHPGCNYRTNFKGNVNVHKRVHRESQYQCQVNGCQFSTPWKNSFNQHQRNHLINNAEITLNVDNHIEVQSEDNESEEEVPDQDENSLTERLPAHLSVHRNVLQTVVPILPVQHIQNLSTNELMAAQRNSESNLNLMQTSGQPIVPSMVGVIKSIKTEI